MIKVQALTDFIAECSFSIAEKEQNDVLPSSVEERDESQHQHEFVWNLFVNGASNSTDSRAEIFLKWPNEFKVCYALSGI